MRVNAIAPAARTRMTEQTPGLGDIVKAPRDPGEFDIWNPANISPLVAYLATEGCPLTGRVLFVQGGQVRRLPALDHDRRPSRRTTAGPWTSWPRSFPALFD